MVSGSDLELYVQASLLRDFFYGKPDHESQIYDSNTYVKEYTYLGIVGEKNEKKADMRLSRGISFRLGEEIEVMKPDGGECLRYGEGDLYSTNRIDVASSKKNLFCTLIELLKLAIFHNYMSYKC